MNVDNIPLGIKVLYSGCMRATVKITHNINAKTVLSVLCIVCEWLFFPLLLDGAAHVLEQSEFHSEEYTR